MNVTEEIRQYLEFGRYRKELDEKTLKAYRIDLRQMAEFIGGEEFSRANLEEYVTELHKNYRKKTIKRKIASMKAFFRYLEENEIIEKNPFEKMRVGFKETVTLPRIIPRNMIEELLVCMYRELYKEGEEKRKWILRDIAVVETLFATGARVCEVSGIRDENVDLETGVIRIMGKGARERMIQIGNRDVLALLRRYKKRNLNTIKRSGYFFINRRGGNFSEQSIRGMIRKYQEAARIPLHITPHMFRHSAATYLLEEEVDIAYIQKILGHSSIKTTQIYIHVESRKQAELLKQRHPRNKMHIPEWKSMAQIQENQRKPLDIYLPPY